MWRACVELASRQAARAAATWFRARRSGASTQHELESKLFTHGGFRETAKIEGLLPHGGGGLKSKVPKRKEFGEVGEAGDAAHEAAMQESSLKEFGSTHVQDKTIDGRMLHVGLFGHWLERNNYGKMLEWHVQKRKAKRPARCMVACERDGSPRIPSEAAMMEYVLAMATGDVESRPKGGWAEYHNGEHARRGLHGKRKGEMMGAEKAFGKGPMRTRRSTTAASSRWCLRSAGSTTCCWRSAAAAR